MIGKGRYKKKEVIALLFICGLLAISYGAWIAQGPFLHTPTGPSSLVQASPYPPSPILEGVTWDLSSLVRFAPGSDLWPVTWASDDHLYTSWGDGGGFGGTNAEGRVSLGFGRISGVRERFKAVNVWGGKNAENPALFGGKATGMLSVDSVLYAWTNMQDAEPPDIRLAWSSDLGKEWKLVSWKFSEASAPFFPQTFLNFGKDYSGARDEFVYVYGGAWDSTLAVSNHIEIARVHRDRIRERAAYEFSKG